MGIYMCGFSHFAPEAGFMVSVLKGENNVVPAGQST